MTPDPARGDASVETPIVFFDGVCNLCNAAINFVIDRDKKGRFRFASLQSDAARRLLPGGLTAPTGEPESMFLLEGGRVYDRSTAALRIARCLSGAWPLLYAFIGIPRPFRDWVYAWVARNRYRWFGKSDVCRVPTPDIKARFLI